MECMEYGHKRTKEVVVIEFRQKGEGSMQRDEVPVLKNKRAVAVGKSPGTVVKSPITQSMQKPNEKEVVCPILATQL